MRLLPYTRELKKIDKHFFLFFLKLLKKERVIFLCDKRRRGENPYPYQPKYFFIDEEEKKMFE